MMKKILFAILFIVPALTNGQFTFQSSNWNYKDSITYLENHTLVFDTIKSEVVIIYPGNQKFTYWIDGRAYNKGVWMFSCRDATVQRCKFFIYPPDEEGAITIEQEGYGTRKFFRN